MACIYELGDGAFQFEFWLSKNLEFLKRYRNEMQKEKDISKIRDIVKELGRLEYNTAKYKKWAESKVEELERYAN